MTKPPSETNAAPIEWSPDGAPISTLYDDIYYSRENGIAECQHIFIDGCQLSKFADATDALSIAETGFGTGLNFLSTWQWRDRHHANCRLSFTSVEKHPLSSQQLSRALSPWPELATYTEQLLAKYPPLTEGWHRISFDTARVDLTLIIADVETALCNLEGNFHAWFLDGFSPGKNPQMWTPNVCEHISRLSNQRTRLATFSAAASVRKNLTQAGFSIEKQPGFGKKKHMLTASVNPAADKNGTAKKNSPMAAPWFARPAPGDNKQALIIGAGLAGCSAAYSLAKRGYEISLVEQADQPAKGASGSAQGLLYTKLSALPSLNSDFYRQGLLYAADRLRALQTRSPLKDVFHESGLLQLAYDAKEIERQRQFLGSNAQPEDLLRSVSAQQASEICGLPLTDGGLFYPHCGWSKPEQLCRALLSESGITPRYNTKIAELKWMQNKWHLFEEGGQCIAKSSNVILATASSTTHYTVTRHLPLKSIRGQTSSIPENSWLLPQLKSIVCGKSSIAPPINDRYNFGATYNLKTQEPEIQASDHQTNMQNLQTLVPESANSLQNLSNDDLQGWVGFRCTTPDYLPLIGPIADRNAFLTDYARLRHDSNTSFSQPGKYLPGLYCSVGHGSKGLISCMLAGEILAYYLTHEASPIPKQLRHAIHPERFLIRDLIHSKI